VNRIERIFRERRSQGLGTLMPFIVGGHPAPKGTGAILSAVEQAGASIAEIGLPFSDPVADGPVIASAMHTAIAAGVTPTGVLDQIAAARAGTQLGLVAMVSTSIVHRLGGPERFCRLAATAGLDGAIFPDLTLEEAAPYTRACSQSGICCSMLIAPTTPAGRAERLAQASTGFVYLLARAGITGEQSAAPEIEASVRRVRAITDLPVAVGFGIASAEHVRSVVRHADAAIVGSALVRRLAQPGVDAESAARGFVAELAQGLTAARTV
jgi:tryptophan synthase alpha chain